MKWLIIGVSSIAMVAIGIGAGALSERLDRSEARPPSAMSAGPSRPAPTLDAGGMDASLTPIWLTLPFAKHRNFVLLEHRADPWEGRLTYFVSHTGAATDLISDLDEVQPELLASFNDVMGPPCQAVDFTVPKGESIELSFRIEDQVIAFDLPEHGCAIESWARQRPSTPVVAGTRPFIEFEPQIGETKLDASSPSGNGLNSPEELARIFESEGLDGITERLPIRFQDGSVLKDIKVSRWSRSAEIWAVAPPAKSREMDAQLRQMSESDRKMINVMLSGMMQAAVCQAVSESGQSLPVNSLDLHLSTQSGQKFIDLEIDTKAC